MNWPFKFRNNILISSLLIFVWIFVSSCKDQNDKKIEAFIENIEATDINTYRNVQFMIFGDNEIYSYYLSDTLFTEWKFNTKISRFEDLDSLKMSKFTNTPLNFALNLRNKIQSIKVTSITQSPAGAKQFWLADNEYVTYVYTDEKNSKSNDLLNEELKTSEKIRDDWHFCRLKVCRNR